MRVEPWDNNRTPPLEPGQETPFDWSVRLSMDMIRAHTKTDDIPGVTDEQLTFYRSVALEAAERYTGLFLAGQKNVTEPVEAKSPKGGRGYYLHRLQYPVADGIVYLYGAAHPNQNRTFHVPIGTTRIKVPVMTWFIDLSNCCDPCSSSRSTNADMWAAYKAGFASPDDVPSLVAQGCLQFIAWVIEHPGDEILTVRNRRDARSEGAMGTNNIAVASGALDTWRILDKDII